MTGFIDPLDTDVPEPFPDNTGDAQLEAVREVVLRAHPNVVPELVTGTSIGDLLASIEPAEAAYAAIAARMASELPPVQVPAGAVGPGVVDPGSLSASEQLRRGLAERQRSR